MWPRKGFSDAREAGLFCDFTLVCGPEEIREHKVIVCSQSLVLRAAVSLLFKENQEGKYQVEDFSGVAVRAMVDVRYEGIYFAAQRDASAADPYDRAHSSIVLHTEVFALADKYIVPGLQTMAQSHFGTDASFVDDAAVLLDCVPDLSIGTFASSEAIRGELSQIIRQKLQNMTLTPAAELAFDDAMNSTPHFATNLLKAVLCDPLLGACSVVAFTRPLDWCPFYAGA